MDLNAASVAAGDFLRRHLFGSKDAGQPIESKLTKGQQELQDWRNHRASQVQQQVEADAKAGGKAMRTQAKGAKPSPAGRTPRQGGGGMGNAITAISAGYSAGMAVDSQRTGKEKGFTSGRGEGRRGAVETGGGGHIPVVTYADGSRVPGAPAGVTPQTPYGGGGSSTPYRSRRQGLDATYPERKPYRSRREGLDATYPDRAPTRDTDAPNPNPDPTIPQKGTLTGGSRSLTPFDMEGFMANIGNKMGVNLRNRFASHQLPGSAEHATALGMTPGEFETAQSAGGVVQLNNGKYVKTSDLNNDNEGGVKTGGLNVDSTAAEVDSFYGVGNNQADELEDDRTLTPEKTNWADRTMADNSDPRVRARAAFLDPTIGSMEALRRAEGEMGVVAQGGRYATQDAEGNTVEIDKKGYMQMMSGQPLAQDFLDTYKNKVIQAAEETVQETTPGAGVETGVGVAAGVDDTVIETIDGNPIEGGAISVAEYNKRFPNDNK